MTNTVTTLMAALLPSPGTLKALVLRPGVGSDMSGLPLVDDCQNLFAHANELGL